jgi:hypothetical protein
VAEVTHERDFATGPRPDDMMALIKAFIYDPPYPHYV